jgi:hypothetical protein
MQITRIFRFLALSAIPALSLVSCGGGENNDVNPVDTTANVEVIDTSSEPVTMLPSPLQVAMIFDKSGLDYDVAYTNDLKAVSKYNTQYDKSLNFGVYSADLAYSVLKDKSKEAAEIIKVVRRLSEDIGLNTVFDQDDILTRFEKNLSNKDSVLEILFVIEENTDDYIEENGEQDKGNVMFAGAWIEGMYIGAQATLKNSNNEVGGKLSEQMIICENLIKALQSGEDTPENQQLISDLKEINDLYMSFDSVKNVEGDEAFNVLLKDDEIKILAEKLIALRNKIVKA